MGALFVLALASMLALAADGARVVQVLDGDSLRLHDGREVRLIGINAPEFGKDGLPDEPLARDARALLTQLLLGKEVRVEHGSEPLDRYRRTLAHIHLGDGSNVEETMLRHGLAVAVAIPPNLAHVETYIRAEAAARDAGRGVWGHSYYQPREAAQLRAHDAGFRFVRGRVQRIGRGRDTIYLDLAEHFTLAIPREHWHYFGGDPQRFLGKPVIARGWITARSNGLRLQLSHPTMLELVD